MGQLKAEINFITFENYIFYNINFTVAANTHLAHVRQQTSLVKVAFVVTTEN
jgi:hypothetical protein